MALVDRLVECDADGGVAEVDLAAGCPLLTADGVLEPLALAELLAQAFAAAHSFTERQRGAAVRRGFLVGVRKLEILGTARRGDRLRIPVRQIAKVGDFVVIEGEVRRADTVLARGNLKLWIEAADSPAAENRR